MQISRKNELDSCSRLACGKKVGLLVLYCTFIVQSAGESCGALFSQDNDRRRRRAATSYGRLRNGEKRHVGSRVFVNPLKVKGRGSRGASGGLMSRANPSASSSSSRAQQHRSQQQQQHQLMQLQVVDSPYDAVLLDNEDIAL